MSTEKIIQAKRAVPLKIFVKKIASIIIGSLKIGHYFIPLRFLPNKFDQQAIKHVLIHEFEQRRTILICSIT